MVSSCNAGLLAALDGISAYSSTEACNEYAMVQSGSTHSLSTDQLKPLWTPQHFRQCPSYFLGRPLHSLGNNVSIYMKAKDQSLTQPEEDPAEFWVPHLC